jgi:hypothetical protein
MTRPLYIVARTVLLDALDALGEQRDALVLVGAQAIYLHTGDADIAVPVFTTDGDLVIEPARLKDEPKLAEAMTRAHFQPGLQPGSWFSTRNVDSVATMLHSCYGVRSADDFMVSIRSSQARPVEERQIGAPPCDEGRYFGEQQCVVAYNYERCEARWRHRRMIASAARKRVRRTKQMAGNWPAIHKHAARNEGGPPLGEARSLQHTGLSPKATDHGRLSPTMTDRVSECFAGKLVGARGFEPPTPRSRTERPTTLSPAPTSPDETTEFSARVIPCASTTPPPLGIIGTVRARQRFSENGCATQSLCPPLHTVPHPADSTLRLP